MSDPSFLPAARREFDDTVDYYETESHGLGDEFAAEVERAFERIAAFPAHGSPHIAGTRRVFLGRFPFAIVYVIRPKGVVVVAVAHPRRRPGYWRGRL